jgi:hypothetical protein
MISDIQAKTCILELRNTTCYSVNSDVQCELKLKNRVVTMCTSCFDTQSVTLHFFLWVSYIPQCNEISFP